MSTDLVPVVGMTCNFGSGKTIWEIVRVDHDTDGNPKQLHLSKAGSDGYTNRWATPGEVRNLTPQTRQVPLGTVLDRREAAGTAAHNLELGIKLKTRPNELANLIKRATETAQDYTRTYALHLSETNAGSTT